MLHTPILLLAIACALFTCTASAVDDSQEGQPGTVRWAPGPSTRGTLDIFWSCLFTVVACVWTILHLNIPAPDQHHLLLRKITWAFANVILPDVILYAALLDRYEVRKKMDQLRNLQEPFEEMGGWVVQKKRPWGHIFLHMEAEASILGQWRYVSKRKRRRG